jgi:hypothetical protein
MIETKNKTKTKGASSERPTPSFRLILRLGKTSCGRSSHEPSCFIPLLAEGSLCDRHHCTQAIDKGHKVGALTRARAPFAYRPFAFCLMCSVAAPTSASSAEDWLAALADSKGPDHRSASWKFGPCAFFQSVSAFFSTKDS